MKRRLAILISVLFVLSLAVIAFAAEMQKGTIKGVDAKAGTITFCQEGTDSDMTLKADKSIDLGAVQPFTKVEVTVEKNVVKSVREIQRPKANYGC